MTDENFQLSQNFDYRFLRNKLEQIDFVIPDTSAATAANYGVIKWFRAPAVIEEVWEMHKTAGSDATAALNLEKLTSGVALDSGTAILATDFELDATANVPRQGTLLADISKRQFARGDRLALDDIGTLTAVAHVVVSIVIRYR